MSEGDLDKSDPASPYKLEKAREKGSVAKSQDISFLVVLFGLTCLIFGLGETLAAKFARVLHASLYRVTRSQLDISSVSAMLATVCSDVVSILAPPLAVVVILVIGAGVMQAGFTVSTEPLKPDFNRINPATGFKRLFAMRSIYDLVRSCIKMVVIALLVFALGGVILKEVVVLPLREPAGILAYLIHETGIILATMTAVLALLALVDLAYTRWEFLKQMRMSKREVKDEHKQREGDPRIKARLRELRLEWFKKGLAINQVKNADVLVTNPTHYAVAISYKRESMAAPTIVAKGSGEVALKMRELARKHGVAVIENPPLARSLYRLTQPADHLPEQHYAEVAKLLVWVFAAKSKTRRPS